MTRWTPYFRFVFTVVFGSIAAMVTACRPGVVPKNSTVPDELRRIANLHAFARLYGVVRWFHPSDAGASIDWDRFAVEGVRRVLPVSDSRALRHVLAETFAPVAPTVQFAATNEDFRDAPDFHANSSDDMEIVSWQHLGYGDSAITGSFASKRRNRARSMPVEGASYGALWQAVDATPYRGAHLRLRGKIRTSSAGRGRLWLRVERTTGTGFFDDMRDRQIASRAWESAELLGQVDADATRIVFGVMGSGNGVCWFDSIELAIQMQDGTWRPLPVADSDFEAPEPLTNWKPGLDKAPSSTIEGWKVISDRGQPASGSSSLHIEPLTQLVTKELFAEGPHPGETVDVDLGDSLRARIPIALYSKNGRTIGDDPIVAKQSQIQRPFESSAGFDREASIADVIVTWNVLEHFWPYWDTISINWINELDIILRDSLNDHSIDDHVATLQRLSAAAPDGHARVACPGMTRNVRPPFAVDLVEEQVVVTATSAPGLRPGDVVIALNRRPAAAVLDDDEALASGSPQMRRVKACAQFGSGPVGSPLTLRIRRGKTEQDVTVIRDDRSAPGISGSPVTRYNDGVYYVDLSRVSMSDLDTIIAHLAAAPGIVFDVRERPNVTPRFLSHLLSHPDDTKWLAWPHIIRPDHSSTAISGWDTDGWQLQVLPPHINGRIAFLTGAHAISYAESVMSLVEFYRLGEIVGSPTPGTNGDVAVISEPTGCSTRFTGLRVTKPDGSRLHLVGVHPTVPVVRTIAGITAGRDEELERALAYIRTGPK